MRILRSTLPEHLPRLASIAVDLRVLGVAAFAALATGVLFGTLPALQFSRPDVAGMLNQGGRSLAGSRASQRLRTALVTAEVALAVVLLAGAGLFISSFSRVLRIDLGLNPEHVVSVGVSPRPSPLSPDRRSDLRASQSLIMAALERTQALPGVVAAAGPVVPVRRAFPRSAGLRRGGARPAPHRVDRGVRSRPAGRAGRSAGGAPVGVEGSQGGMGDFVREFGARDNYFTFTRTTFAGTNAPLAVLHAKTARSYVPGDRRSTMRL